MCGWNEVRINEDQMWTTKRRSRSGHYNILAEIPTRRPTQQSVQTTVSFYLLNKILRYVGIVLLVAFSVYLESFSMVWSGIRYIWKNSLAYILLNQRVSDYCWQVPIGTRKWMDVELKTPIYFAWTHISLMWCAHDSVNSRVNGISVFTSDVWTEDHPLGPGWSIPCTTFLKVDSACHSWTRFLVLSYPDIIQRLT